jgi:hypothetical protein
MPRRVKLAMPALLAKFTTYSTTIENYKQTEQYTKKVKKSFVISLRPSPSGCPEKRVGGIHSGYITDDKSHGLQSSESRVEGHIRKWKTTSTSTTKPSSVWSAKQERWGLKNFTLQCNSCVTVQVQNSKLSCPHFPHSLLFSLPFPV